MLAEDIEQESTPEFDKLMAMFEPRFAAAPWEVEELPPLGFGALLQHITRAVHGRYDTQAMEVIIDGGIDSGADTTAGPGEGGDPTGGGVPQ